MMKNDKLGDDPNAYPFTLDGPIATTCFCTIERFVGCTENCNPLDITVDREPDFLHPTEHVCETSIDGTSESDNYRSDTWYVDTQFYRLTTIKVWKDSQAFSGIEVTYTPPDGYIGWPEYRKMFGYEHLQAGGTTPEEITFTKDLEYIEICADDHIKGFKFLEYDESTETELIADAACTNWQKIDLKTDPSSGEPLQSRIVGFTVQTQN